VQENIRSLSIFILWDVTPYGLLDRYLRNILPISPGLNAAFQKQSDDRNHTAHAQ
jgi:hypothetical protein